MRVLCISAHPDDMEINCAGTLLKCKARGDEVFVCHINNGDMGHFQIMPEELGKMRIEEARRSCEMAGFTALTANIGDLDSYYQDKEQKDIIVDIIRQVNPDFIITMSPNDYMCDHTAASQLVFDAAFMASVPHYETKHPATDKVVPIFYMDNAYGVDFVPTEYVDISDVFDMKIKMLLCHQSQAKWLMEHDNIDYTRSVRIISSFRGLQCGVEFAEGFTQCKTALKLLPKRMLP
ncbi:MAG: PIG-L deacetylase family protein [Oscillospiraceae bacterium]|nr:PIG-L deacetylase family protein [Oscillospiraceae bacterium]